MLNPERVSYEWEVPPGMELTYRDDSGLRFTFEPRSVVIHASGKYLPDRVLNVYVHGARLTANSAEGREAGLFYTDQPTDLQLSTEEAPEWLQEVIGQARSFEAARLRAPEQAR